MKDVWVKRYEYKFLEEGRVNEKNGKVHINHVDDHLDFRTIVIHRSDLEIYATTLRDALDDYYKGSVGELADRTQTA